MIWLQYALWRRDVAARKLVRQRQLGERRVLWPRDRRREDALEQRLERWARVALIAERRLLRDATDRDQR